MAQLHEAAWQYMLEEPPNELYGGHCRCGIAACTKSNRCVGYLNEAMVRNAYAMGIAAEVAVDCFCTSEGLFGIGYPLGADL